MRGEGGGGDGGRVGGGSDGMKGKIQTLGDIMNTYHPS